MILELDAGNSSIKWRRFGATGDKEPVAGTAGSLEELDSSAALAVEPVAVRFGCVRGRQFSVDIRRWCQQRWGLTAQEALVRRRCGGVANHYANPRELGVDRWLAMLAAYRRAGGACVVVDGGTALTIDALDAQGEHLGGYILPGLGLTGSALESNTTIRLGSRAHPTGTLPGHSTDAAVLNGALAAAVALIERTVGALSVANEPAWLYFSGGDARLLKDNSELTHAEIVPELVLDGLAIACPVELSPDATERRKQAAPAAD